MRNIIFRDPVFDGAADPTVIRRASDGRYFMFYTQRRATLECSGVEWAHGTRIGVAVCDADPFGDAASGESVVANGKAVLPPSEEGGGVRGSAEDDGRRDNDGSSFDKTPCRKRENDVSASCGTTPSQNADQRYLSLSLDAADAPSIQLPPQREPRTGDARPYGTGDAGWRYAGTAELPFTEGETTYWAPEVIFDGESYRMFVSSVDGVYADWAGKAEILQFVSPDLEKWAPLGAVPIDSERVIDACAFPLPAGGWRLWYKDEKRGSHTFYTDTFDFREWRPGGEATSDTDQEGPNVFALGGRYWLVADVWNGLAVYVSDDLTDFTRAGEDLLPGAASHADVFVEDGRARLVYFCYPEGNRRSAVACCELVTDGEGLIVSS